LGLYLIGIPVLAFGFFVMFDTHAAWKVAIPQFVPFGWDPPLARFDALIHLGTDPWRWSHALPLRNALTLGLDGVYMLWYYSVAGTAMVALALLPEDRRARFFVGFLLLWITAGTVAAIALASGGPVYYGYLTGDPDRFAALLDAVDGTFARALQEELWTAFMTERDVAYRGVSAMPSMHVAAILYFAAWGWSLHPALGVLGTAYGLLIFWGSVHLGWHYAVDGYVAAAFALVCWAVVRVKGQRTGQNSVRGAPASSIPPSGSS
jgi:hypothetical protein